MNEFSTMTYWFSNPHKYWSKEACIKGSLTRLTPTCTNGDDQLKYEFSTMTYWFSSPKNIGSASIKDSLTRLRATCVRWPSDSLSSTPLTLQLDLTLSNKQQKMPPSAFTTPCSKNEKKKRPLRKHTHCIPTSHFWKTTLDSTFSTQQKLVSSTCKTTVGCKKKKTQRLLHTELLFQSLLRN